MLYIGVQGLGRVNRQQDHVQSLAPQTYFCVGSNPAFHILFIKTFAFIRE